MEKQDKIVVSGFDVMIDTAIVNALYRQGFEDVIEVVQEQVNLSPERGGVLFEREKPAYVFLTAPMAGGLAENQEHLADFSIRI